MAKHIFLSCSVLLLALTAILLTSNGCSKKRMACTISQSQVPYQPMPAEPAVLGVRYPEVPALRPERLFYPGPPPPLRVPTLEKQRLRTRIQQAPAAPR